MPIGTNTVILGMTLCILFLLFPACHRRSDVKNMKDLDENMMDLRVYQENLGDQIRSGKLKDGEWLLTGLDSILQLLSTKFAKHRKLSEPFSYYYKKRLRKPLRNIQIAIDNNDTASAWNNYQILVKKCNNCHIDHDIDKVVRY
jgi:hypothetical protein